MRTRVVVETTPKRAFASALDWPGWSRGGKTADDALEALVASGPRYATVAERAGVDFTAPTSPDALDIVERLEGSSGTEFGIPAVSAAADDAPLSAGDLDRLVGLLRAAWDAFDQAAERAAGVSLTLGPRGGGRQVPKIVEHVHGADSSYLNQLGAKPPKGAPAAELREAFVAALAAKAAGKAVANPNRVSRPWSPRYAIRRSAWHSLDHAWEIDDRTP